ncbi:MAG: hypothetical protein JNL41_16855 [Phenylobacterium sp.]|uniref:hypothetical protein n=1 Tax=Phenylobacterium sp. TaxID=1871053 RepID=UPI001A4AE4D0|nr:hypothetical protein [Phenylobacterium sp.]MBL8555949.1 hypothetical protein [Phenylobacterium sp.]
MLRGSTSAAAALAVMLAGPASGQAPPAAPRALARNFDGVWTNATVTQLERSAAYSQLVVPNARAEQVDKATTARRDAANGRSDLSQGAFKDENATAGYNSFWIDAGEGLMRVRGEARSSFITSPADGRMPFRDRARSLALTIRDGAEYRSGKGAYAGPEDLPIRERCLIAQSDAGGPVMLNAIYNNNYSFFVTPGYFVIDLEMNHDVRIAPIFASAKEARASHAPAVIRPWLGDTVAWWEGDTLVAETKNVNPIQEGRTLTPVSSQGTVTERFTRIARDELLYQFTVEDPVHYTQAWSGEYSFKPAKGQIYEYACHEGNYAMEGILRGARMAEEADKGGQ